MIKNIIDIFSNRELAVALWVTIFLMWGIYSPTMRASFVDVIKAFFVKRIVMVILLMVSYVALISWLLNITGLWDMSQFKNTVLWCLTAAAVMLFRVDTLSDKKHFFKNAIIDNLKIIIILEFIINVHSLNIWLELILVPFSTILVLLIAVAELEEKHKIFATILNRVLMILGTFLIIYSLYAISNDMHSFVTFATFQSFILPPVLSLAYLPFIYFFALFMAYESLFIRYTLILKDSIAIKNAKTMTFQHININLYNLKQWSNFITPQHFKNNGNIENAIQEFRSTI